MNPCPWFIEMMQRSPVNHVLKLVIVLDNDLMPARSQRHAAVAAHAFPCTLMTRIT